MDSPMVNHFDWVIISAFGANGKNPLHHILFYAQARSLGGGGLGEKSTNNFVHHLVMVSVGMFFTNLKQYTTTYQQIIIWTSW